MELLSLVGIIGALSFWGTAVTAGLFLLLVLLCGWDDSRPNDAGNWLLLAFAIFAGGFLYLFRDTQLSTFTTWGFWKPCVHYLGIGLVYFAWKFMHTLIKARSELPEMWATFIQKLRRDSKAILSTKSYEASAADIHSLHMDLKVFGDQITRKFLFLGIKPMNDDTYRDPEIELKVGRLSRHMTSWTLLWPAYLIANLVFDVLVDGFKHLARFIKYIFGGIVTRMFAGIFVVPPMVNHGSKAADESGDK